MYSAGAIGVWSMIEEGIGIIAGSMPALRPLLDLSIFRRGTSSSGSDSRLLCLNGKDYEAAMRGQGGNSLRQIHEGSVDVITCSSSAGESGSSLVKATR
jgi:hypothetical protein